MYEYNKQDRKKLKNQKKLTGVPLQYMTVYLETEHLRRDNVMMCGINELSL